MQWRQSCWWMMIIIICLFDGISTDRREICQICHCDQRIPTLVVHCDSENLSSLENIRFSSEIETLSLMSNSLTLQSAQDVQKINELTRLNTLSLSKNPLLTIPALSLPQLTYLQLENTDLHSAQFPSSFENCTHLRSIVLSNNALNTITADDFRSLSSPLRKLSIENSQLHSIDRTAFVRLSNTLESISLPSNSLTSADFFPTMTNLLSINLDNNDFEELPGEIPQPGRTKHFFFRHNKIETINESSPLFDWAKANITGVNIYLNNNPFDCCQSRWFIDYLSSPKNLVHDAGRLTCASPEDYSGQRLIDLRSKQMDCDKSLFHRLALHSDKFLIALICLSSIATFIIVVVGMTLYRHSRLHLRRRSNYERY